MTTRARETRFQSRVDERQLQRVGAGALREDDQDRVILPTGAPLVAADEYVKRYRCQGDVPTLRAYRGAFYLWTGTHYRDYPQEKVEADLYAFLGEALAIAKNGNFELSRIGYYDGSLTGASCYRLPTAQAGLEAARASSRMRTEGQLGRR